MRTHLGLTPQASGMKRTASGNTTVGVNGGIVDGDHIGDNGLGLAVNVSEGALGVEDGVKRSST